MKQSYPVIQKGKPNKLSLIKVEQRRTDPRPQPEPNPKQPNMGVYLLILFGLLVIGLLCVAVIN
jgi:hypothetical protein